MADLCANLHVKTRGKSKRFMENKSETPASSTIQQDHFQDGESSSGFNNRSIIEPDINSIDSETGRNERLDNVGVNSLNTLNTRHSSNRNDVEESRLFFNNLLVGTDKCFEGSKRNDSESFQRPRGVKHLKFHKLFEPMRNSKSICGRKIQ
ncbi:hypothetical protein CEXT_217351 [Caerostris extrusa]|uniref:Uncharacterized protein n=1 Tax=Caerostris extrusa TaxID=172846 RepID=A0AAV4SIE9_CAEEX|nr:hypothetical protein CEXT_217351 [Caerostris extrusa]